MERLDKFLCDCGMGTRSQVKSILKSGIVTVNGVSVKDGSVKIDPEKQSVLCSGTPVRPIGRLVVMLNKPAGYVTATRDATEQTVMELLPQELRKRDLKPVGRLDKQTEGLLLFTNDGDLIHRLIHPQKAVEKVYYARHKGTATDEDVQAFAEGLMLRDGTKCRPAVLKPLGAGESLVTVCEGMYHQVRRMMASRGMTVEYLERRQEGNMLLGDLKRGEIRVLTQEECSLLDK